MAFVHCAAWGGAAVAPVPEGARSQPSELTRMIPRDLPVYKDQIMLAAHRGGRGIWPENTLFAFKKAVERWPDVFLEGDLHLSKDGQVVVIHDDTVDRTTDGTGRINDLTLEEIQSFDAGYRFTTDGGETFPFRGQGVRIPTFRELLEGLPNSRIVLELKEGHLLPDAAIALVREYKAENRIIFGSFDAALMNQVREKAPEIMTCYDFTSAYKLVQALRIGGWDEYEPNDSLLTITQEIEKEIKVTAEEIEKMKEKGIVYQIHTINDPQEMREYMDMGVDSILTDRPDLLEQVIAERKAKG
jgi:glycerophosphoryl diester phosphodiesterase